MAERQTAIFAGIIERRAIKLDPADDSAFERLYQEIVRRNEDMIARKADQLDRDQQTLLRAALDTAIAAHRGARAPRAPAGAPTRGKSVARRALAIGAPLVIAAGLLTYAYLELPGAPGHLALAEIELLEPADVEKRMEKSGPLLRDLWRWQEPVRAVSIDEPPSSLRRLSIVAGGFEITGEDPQLIYNLSHIKHMAAELPYVGFDFRCLDGGSARLQIFWWGDGQKVLTGRPSLSFDARQGLNIVPIGGSPSWTTLTQLSGIRFDPEERNGCSRIAFSGLAFYGHPR